MKKTIYLILISLVTIACTAEKKPIDRKQLVYRNNPKATEIDSLASFSVGNGEIAFTVDVTGLQTFPKRYSLGVPLGTQSQWGFHSFPNVNNYKEEETLKDYDFRGKPEPYAVQFNEPGRSNDAANYFRANPHRLHLGIIGFDMEYPSDMENVKNINQELDMWRGVIVSHFDFKGHNVSVETACHPLKDMLAAQIKSDSIPAIKFHFAYPTGEHSDDACDWDKNDKHSTIIVTQTANSALLKRIIDDAVYYVGITWDGDAVLSEKEKNYLVLQPSGKEFAFETVFLQEEPKTSDRIPATQVITDSEKYWESFWMNGGVVDFSECKDKRAPELERRVVLSQYLLAIQCSGSTPPQETGLTYNSWYGKFHMEMIWWHTAQFALWNRSDLMERSLNWYEVAYPAAKAIAERQGFKGVRWMKMTDPTAIEAPSKVGSFLIWQQPHLIYLAELAYRNNQSEEFLRKYAKLIDETAEFMYSFATYEQLEGRFVLKGIIPAQETLRASETVNPPFELAYWHFGMSVAQKWRERLGQPRNEDWDEMISHLSPLAHKDGLYLAAETAPDTYEDIRYTSDHMAVLGALGILPKCPLVRTDYMQNTLNWVWDNWNWGKTWGWDYPMTAMNAARLGDAEKAVGALLMDKRTNRYLVNGHNYKDSRLRIYLPGNGGLLTAVAMMCAGWDGCETENPGFPKDGNWDVRWEGLKKMP